MNDNSVAIVIPVFNRIEYTKKCLDNLFKLREASNILDKELHVVVVDDGSEDGTSDWIKENHPTIHILYGDGNLWWSGGINKGVRYALDVIKSDYVLWWNNDILAAPDYLVNLFRIIKNNSTDIIIGSKIFSLNHDHLFGMGGIFDAETGNYGMHGHKQPDNEIYKQPFEVDWFPGMGTIIHRTVFEKIGFVDEKNFPQYHGDSDFTLRAKQEGFRLIAFPDLVIYNDGSNRVRSDSLYKSLTHIRSLFNIKKYLLFLRRHSTSLKAYLSVFKKYFYYIGGFYKWKFLNFFGINRPEHGRRRN